MVTSIIKFFLWYWKATDLREEQHRHKKINHHQEETTTALEFNTHTDQLSCIKMFKERKELEYIALWQEVALCSRFDERKSSISELTKIHVRFLKVQLPVCDETYLKPLHLHPFDLNMPKHISKEHLKMYHRQPFRSETDWGCWFQISWAASELLGPLFSSRYRVVRHLAQDLEQIRNWEMKPVRPSTWI